MLGTIKEFFTQFFEQEVNILFTPDFFPFVEPGGMISIDCSNLGEGFKKVSKGTGWLEVLGCGMIHPNVLDMAGIDSKAYSGFAWGVGLERLIMLKYNIDDIRLFHSGDLRFIRQFK
jgi:phenylalanyl-tRNA synthetase alpha chain